MKKTKYILWILAVEAVGVIAAVLTRQGMSEYSDVVMKPALSPPGVVFGVVWTVLYGLMGIGAARIAAEPFGPARSRGLNLFVIQLAVNFFWSLIFFNAAAYGFALLWLLMLWLLILLMIHSFRKLDKTASWLQVPYLVWVTFAAYLNYMVWQLNR